jgi:hypothetical protein
MFVGDDRAQHVPTPLRRGISGVLVLEKMILERILLSSIGKHAAPLEVVGGGELEGDRNNGADAGEGGRESPERRLGGGLGRESSGGGGILWRHEERGS